MRAVLHFALTAVCALALGLYASAPARAADCYQSAESCVEGPETRIIAGHAVQRDCWRLRATYTCIAADSTDDCQPLSDRGCSQVASTCMDTGPQGACLLSEERWRCRSAPGSTSTVTNCAGQRYCLNGYCFDTGYEPDADFARAVAGLEAQREAGQYLDPDTLEVFKGYDNRCRKKLFGLVNCCKGGGTDGSLFSNLNLIASAGGHAAGAVGSSYTFDALFTADAPDLVISGFEALFGAGGGSSALAGLIAGDISVSSFVTALAPGPWTMAMIAIQVSGLLNCKDAEQILAMKRDNRLCHSLGSYCSKRLRIIRTCVETTQSYCCFNSRLSRILNEQGRAQLARGWGSAKRPDCRGFTLAQLQSLDFARMDLSEFYVEIAPSLPNMDGLQQRAQQRIDSYFRP
jgi:conjugal transfer mating pair stabilization protein TraN